MGKTIKQLTEELEAKEKLLDDAYAYIKNLENFFAKNHGYLDTDFEAIKQTGDTIPRYMANEAENAILKGKNKELLDENAELKWKNRVYLSNLSESADCIKDLHNENEKLKERLNKIYGAGGDLDGNVIMLPGCKISYNARAGCYTFDIGGHHIVATNKGHIFIDKE